MRTLITGGSGFVGSHLAEALLEDGQHVTVIDNLSTGRVENISHLVDHPRFEFVIETVTNEVVMDRLVSECDLIYHLAAAVGVKLIISNPVRVIETNVLGTNSVLRMANRYRKKVLLASTSEIYGKNIHQPFTENDDRLLGSTTKARWCYSASKAVDEFLALAYHRERGLPVVIFRLFNTVGPRQTGRYGMVVPRFVKQALSGEPITVYGDGQQSRCFCYISDVIKGIITLAEHPSAVGEVFNIGSDDEITILKLAKRVRRLAESNSEIVYIPYDQAYTEGFEDLQRRVPDITKIWDVIGWKPKVSLEGALKQVIAYSRERTDIYIQEAARSEMVSFSQT